jgi:acetyltransferase
VRPDDEPRYTPFFATVSPEDIRLRFFTGRRTFPHTLLARLTQIDYAREMPFVAIREATGELLGVSRLVLKPDRKKANSEFSTGRICTVMGLGGISCRP